MHRAALIASLLALGACSAAPSETPRAFSGAPGYAEMPGYPAGPGYPGMQGHPGMVDPYAPRAMGPQGMQPYGMPPYGMPQHEMDPYEAAPDRVRPHGMRMPRAPHRAGAGPRRLSAGAREAARRLYTVADTVMLRGAALCEDRLKRHTGLRASSDDDQAVSVFTLARGGPAERAGLNLGDRITSINGEAIPAASGAMRVYAAKIEAALARSSAIAFGYERDGQRATARVVPAPACDVRVVFTDSPMINAATDGRSVMVMRGLVNTLSRDDELALVVGHELSHNVLGHFSRGRALGHNSPFSGASASMRQFEREADYVGLYFVALSGFDYQSAIESSRRMAAMGPLEDRGSETHPSQSERYAALSRTASEIRAKLAKGGPLRPNLPTGRAALENAPSYAR